MFRIKQNGWEKAGDFRVDKLLNLVFTGLGKKTESVDWDLIDGTWRI